MSCLTAEINNKQNGGGKMTATDQMRAMLDQLMGTSRNGKVRGFIYFVPWHICLLLVLTICNYFNVCSHTYL